MMKTPRAAIRMAAGRTRCPESRRNRRNGNLFLFGCGAKQLVYQQALLPENIRRVRFAEIHHSSREGEIAQLWGNSAVETQILSFSALRRADTKLETQLRRIAPHAPGNAATAF